MKELTYHKKCPLNNDFYIENLIQRAIKSKEGEDPYKNREIDEKFGEVHEKLDEIINKVDYTNGKVRKIIIVLSILSGFVVGILGKDIAPLIMAVF